MTPSSGDGGARQAEGRKKWEGEKGQGNRGYMGAVRDCRGQSVLTSLASGSAASSLGGRGPALLPGPPATPPSTRGDSSSCSRFSWSGELHLELNSGESGRWGGLGGSGGRDGEGEWEPGVGGPSAEV